MARKLRVEYPGAIYHGMNRGDRREAIVKDAKDRERFLETLGEVCARADWQVHASVLMHNHFHLVVETPNANLVAGLHWFLSTYKVAGAATVTSPSSGGVVVPIIPSRRNCTPFGWYCSCWHCRQPSCGRSESIG